MSNFKPMLASPVDFSKLIFPVFASIKLDGIRAVVIGGVVYSRNLKPIPNQHVQRMFGQYEGYDGELICGDPAAPDCFRKTTSAVMSYDGEPDVQFWVFDHIVDPRAQYRDRRVNLVSADNVVVHYQHIADSIETIEAMEAAVLAEGHEGLILRSPTAPYKFGRSTTNEGYLLKLKRFADAEFTIIGFEERMHNANVATIDELGRTKRSSHQENLIGRGDLGALVLEHENGSFNVGTGFDDATRTLLWEQRFSLIGQKAKVKYFAVGGKDVPRFPVFLGLRHEGDM